MLSKQQFAQNKFMRYTAYAIVFGFALMMFLPGSFSLLDVFSGRSLGSGGITVDGVDIINKQIPLYGLQLESIFYGIRTGDLITPSKMMYQININRPSIIGVIGNTIKTKKQQQLVLASLKGWEQWQNTSSDPREMFSNPLTMVRSRLLDVILWQMDVQLAKELNYNLSKKKFNKLTEKAFQAFLNTQYKAAKQNAASKKRKMLGKEDFIYTEDNKWRESYYKWAHSELKERYLHSMVADTFMSGVLPVAADIEQEYLLDNHKVQVDYALYTYDQHFIKEPVFQEKVKEKIEDLKKYYRQKEEKVDIQRVEFSSEEKAKEAQKDPELFMDLPKSQIKKKAKYQAERRTYYADNDMFKKLVTYKKGEVTLPLKDSTNDKIFYIYKIIDRSKPFDQLKKNSKEYKTLLEDYGKDHYSDFKEDYEKQAQKVLKAFIAKASAVKDFRKIKRGEKPLMRHLKVGRTDFFTQTAPVINEVAKTDKKKKVPESIKEFQSNSQFIKTSFTLKPGELSPEVLSEEIAKDDSPIIPLDETKKSGNRKKVFFVVKMINEKVPQIDVLKAKDKKRQIEGIVRSIKRTDFTLLNSLWLPYLKKTRGYKVQFNY